MSQDTATAPVRSHRRRRTILLIAIALILVVAISIVAVSCQTGDETGPPTVTVDRGTVALAVSASGSIAPAGRQSLGFADGGTVTQVLVNVGDQVQPGQPIYAAAFAVLAHNRTLCARMDYLVLDELVAIHNKAVAKAENELALLGALPKQPPELTARIARLLGEVETAEGSIAQLKSEMAVLKKMMKSKKKD